MNDSAPTHSYQPTISGKDTNFEVVTFAAGHAAPPIPPESIGRYRVERVLGMGSFGIVYLAHDDLLQRPVAVKVPHAGLAWCRDDAEVYLAEARTVANLDHPNIVPVHDVGSAAGFPCYIVSKYIDGTNLAVRLRSSRPPVAETVEVVAAVAEAVHHAHLQGLVHRDIKPSNILLDGRGKAFVADFGLAMRERDSGQGPSYAGTPPYMSPEQARGEGHRVDGRSDVFSIGIVLYEMLTGQRPFRGQTQEELFEQINTLEARPLRQIDDTIPAQLERICLKALAKRAADRYTTAKDMADDLRQSAGEPPALRPAAPPDPDGPVSDSHGVAVIPKGLRAFETDDADFFLDLLPGPRDRHGLPEVVHFWKARIEESDPDRTFPVGLLYGPSGCGKSSLVKAGLLSRLAPHVKTLYLEATADLEVRLLHRLGRACPEAAHLAELPRAFAAVRRGPPGEKVLVVLDQFEQWLHAPRDGADGELVRALRQCDGARLQCLILVRDDFWMSAARFMRELEVPVVEGHNAAAVDRFDRPHARKVLAAFGRAYGALPARTRDLTPDQSAFLDRAVAELAQDGWVVPVRLALFADLVKRRPWTAALLGELGGAVGVGVTYLDESFMAATAPPEHRLHQQAVRAVLSALLPAPGTDIKGHTRSRTELLEASGYGRTPEEFDGLMRILIGETRLLTPVATDAPGAEPAGGPRYQLTHDYLVPSIRDWLTRKRMETRRGRAELRLTERAALWQAKPEVRQLPSLTEWLTIRLLTRPRAWTEGQRRLMRAASRRHLVTAAWATAVAVLLLTCAFVFRARLAEDHADALVRRLLDANVAEVPGIVDELHEFRRWTDPALERVLADPGADRGRQLRARLGLLPADHRHAADLLDRLLEADPNEFPVIRNALAPHRSALGGRLWGVLASERDEPDRRFRAAAALAAYEPADLRWEGTGRWVARQLVEQPALARMRWVEALRPVKDRLTPALGELVPLRTASATAAAEILGDYAADRPDVLAEALADAGSDSFAHLFPPLRARPDRAVPVLSALLDRAAPANQDANTTAGRRANVAVALLRLGDGERLWPLLGASPDPRVRSFLIDRFAPLGADPKALSARLDAEPDATVRAALWLGLGGFDDQTLPPDRRAALVPAVVRAYHEDDSAAVHAATWWLLGRWDARPRAGQTRPTARAGPDGRKQWYVNGAGQTMVRIAGPVEFMMGSPPEEPRNPQYEQYHKARIEYPFDIGMTEVTVGQFRPFLETRAGTFTGPPDKLDGASEDVPVTAVTWYAAAAYCNWLSETEGIPRDQWCYEPNADRKYAEGMKIVPGYRQRKGYRLPTEKEWEFACRGGAVTRRCYGDADELLPRYAWYAANAGEGPSPVARLLPNAFGLFDMHGNAGEWCQDVVRPYEDTADDDADSVVMTGAFRAARGGHNYHHAKMLRSAKRFSDRPSVTHAGGFRLARGSP